MATVRGPQLEMKKVTRFVSDVENIITQRPGSPTYLRLPDGLREALDEQVIAWNRVRDRRAPRRTLTDEIVERLQATFHDDEKERRRRSPRTKAGRLRK